MIKAIIFDLDGTLLNTSQDLTDAINSTLKDFYKEEVSVKEVLRNIGNGNVKLVERCLNPKDEKELKEGVEKFKYYYNDCYSNKTKPYEGIKEVIEWIQKENIKIGVFSNKYDEYTKNLIKINFKNINEEFVFGKAEGYKLKPDPEVLFEILKRMKIKIEDALYIGDSGVDVETANNANIKMLTCTWGFRSKEELIKANAINLIDSPKEIIDYIKEKNNA